MNETQLQQLTQPGGHFFRYWMPYVFRKVHCKRYTRPYLPLNRNYKPLGFLDREWVDYQSYISTLAVFFRSDPAKFDGIWWNVDEQGEHMWLYEDALDSRRDYFQRLEKLMAKSIKLVKGDAAFL